MDSAGGDVDPLQLQLGGVAWSQMKVDGAALHRWFAQSGSSQSVTVSPSLSNPSLQTVSFQAPALQRQPVGAHALLSQSGRSAQSLAPSPSLSALSWQLVSVLTPALHTQPFPHDFDAQSGSSQSISASSSLVFPSP